MKKFFRKLIKHLAIWYFERKLAKIYDEYLEDFMGNILEARDKQMLPQSTIKKAIEFNNVLTKRNQYDPPSVWKPYKTIVTRDSE